MKGAAWNSIKSVVISTQKNSIGTELAVYGLENNFPYVQVQIAIAQR